MNCNGGSGKNVHIDLHMEHLNRLLKDIIIGLGAESSIVSPSMQLYHWVNHLINSCAYICIKPRVTLQRKFRMKTVLKQLTSDSNMFDYIPGTKPLGFKTFPQMLLKSIDAEALYKRKKQIHVAILSAVAYCMYVLSFNRCYYHCKYRIMYMPVGRCIHVNTKYFVFILSDQCFHVMVEV